MPNRRTFEHMGFPVPPVGLSRRDKLQLAALGAAVFILYKLKVLR